MRGLGELPHQLDAEPCEPGEVVLDGAQLEAVDSAGSWLLRQWLQRQGAVPTLRGWPPRLATLMQLANAREDGPLPQTPQHALLQLRLSFASRLAMRPGHERAGHRPVGRSITTDRAALSRSPRGFHEPLHFAPRPVRRGRPEPQRQSRRDPGTPVIVMPPTASASTR